MANLNRSDHLTPLVGVIMGSSSDWSTMRDAVEILEEFGIPHERRVVSAHRMPEDLGEYGRTARSRGLKVVIAGAGGAAHLPGMIAAFSPLPVIGVPIESRTLKGLDSLLSIVQMPGGVPVATVAIGGAKNAGILAAQIVATTTDPAWNDLTDKIVTYKRQLEEKARGMSDDLIL